MTWRGDACDFYDADAPGNARHCCSKTAIGKTDLGPYNYPMGNLSLLKNTEAKEKQQTLANVPVESAPLAPPAPLEQKPPPSPKVGFDLADSFKRELYMDALPLECREEVRAVTEATANALVKEGAPTVLRMLARDISLRHLAVSQADSLLALARHKARMDPCFDVKRLQAAEKSAAGEHQRLLAAIEAFERLSRPSNPTLRISGGPNFVNVEGQEER
jgi:hypothetical protein